MTAGRISRRKMMIATGSGVVGATLAGCAGNESSNGSGERGLLAKLGPNEIGERVDAFLLGRGIPPMHYGDNPNLARPGTSGPPFKPNYMVLVHLTSSGPWDLASNHAHFYYPFVETEPNHIENRIMRACKIFSNKNSRPHKRFKEENTKPNPTPEYKVHNRNSRPPPNDFADEQYFDPFVFGSQHDIYVFFEHEKDEIRFDELNNRLIMFSTHHNDSTSADLNRSFFSARLINDRNLLGGIHNKGTLIRIENHYSVLDVNGVYQLIGSSGQPTSQHYKMDIIFINSSGLVMAIDPDTGNGTGWQP